MHLSKVTLAKKEDAGRVLVKEGMDLVEPSLVMKTIDNSSPALHIEVSRTKKDGDQIMGKSVAVDQVSRDEIRDLNEEVVYKAACLGVDKNGHSLIKGQLNLRCLDELIRQDTLNCAERGVFLKEIRDFLALQFHMYEEMMVGAKRFCLQEINKAQNDDSKQTLLADRAEIVQEIHDMSKVLENQEVLLEDLEREFKTKEDALSRVREDQVLAMRRCNLHLLNTLGAVNPQNPQLAEIHETILKARKLNNTLGAANPQNPQLAEIHETILKARKLGLAEDFSLKGSKCIIILHDPLQYEIRMALLSMKENAGSVLVKEGMDLVRYSEPSLVMKTIDNSSPASHIEFQFGRDPRLGFPVTPKLPGLYHREEYSHDSLFTKGDLEYILDGMFPFKVWTEGDLKKMTDLVEVLHIENLHTERVFLKCDMAVRSNMAMAGQLPRYREVGNRSVYHMFGQENEFNTCYILYFGHLLRTDRNLQRAIRRQDYEGERAAARTRLFRAIRLELQMNQEDLCILININFDNRGRSLPSIFRRMLRYFRTIAFEEQCFVERQYPNRVIEALPFVTVSENWDIPDILDDFFRNKMIGLNPPRYFIVFFDVARERTFELEYTVGRDSTLDRRRLTYRFNTATQHNFSGIGHTIGHSLIGNSVIKVDNEVVSHARIPRTQRLSFRLNYALILGLED